MKNWITISAALGIVALGGSIYAANNKVSMTSKGGQTCIASNGVPTHSIDGSRSASRFRATNQEYCFDTTPTKTAGKTTAPISGVTVTGIPIRPGTAEFYDPNGRNNISRDRSSGWNVEAIGPGDVIQLDNYNGHSDGRGLYHYHGMPTALININGSSLMAYAADGHEIHYVGGDAQSSWRLKSGSRASGPGGAYDGTYVQDYEYVAGSGNLDECNGGMVNGKYVYFATDTFPYYPRCVWGEVSSDLEQRGQGGGERRGPNPKSHAVNF